MRCSPKAVSHVKGGYYLHEGRSWFVSYRPICLSDDGIGFQNVGASTQEHKDSPIA